MQRRYELIDLVVAVGLCATVAAGGLLFVAANGMLSVSRSGGLANEQPTGKIDGMEWLQPMLGRTIVDQDLLDRRHEIRASAARAELIKATDEYRRWQNSPFGYLSAVKMSAARAEVDHHDRVQAVMGRSIVQFTRRGVRSGVLSSEGDVADFNPRMIESADAMGRRMDSRFSAEWQPNLGRSIVAATHESESRSALRQERLGSAILQLAVLESVYAPARAAIQEQLGGATVVAALTQSFADYAGPDRSMPYSPPTAGAHTIWMDMPMSAIAVASLILASLFSVSLFVFPSAPGVRGDDRSRIGPAELAYPKPA